MIYVKVYKNISPLEGPWQGWFLRQPLVKYFVADRGLGLWTNFLYHKWKLTIEKSSHYFNNHITTKYILFHDQCLHFQWSSLNQTWYYFTVFHSLSWSLIEILSITRVGIRDHMPSHVPYHLGALASCFSQLFIWHTHYLWKTTWRLHCAISCDLLCLPW